MNRHIHAMGKFAAAFGLAFAFSGAALATPTNLVPTGKTNPPIGHFEFCKSHSGECGSLGKDRGPMKLTRALWAQMLDVNTKVNQSIRPDTDLNIYGVEELWTYPRTVGDCEDYVLLKRHMLLERGFSPHDLLITVVLQPNGDGHAVLTVATDLGDFVLDNLEARVLAWTDTQYRFLKRQSATNSGQWVKINDSRQDIVGSVKR